MFLEFLFIKHVGEERACLPELKLVGGTGELLLAGFEELIDVSDNDVANGLLLAADSAEDGDVLLVIFGFDNPPIQSTAGWNGNGHSFPIRRLGFGGCHNSRFIHSFGLREFRFALPLEYNVTPEGRIEAK